MFLNKKPQCIEVGFSINKNKVLLMRGSFFCAQCSFVFLSITLYFYVLLCIFTYYFVFLSITLYFYVLLCIFKYYFVFLSITLYF